MILSKEEVINLLNTVGRSETVENPRVYLKAIRCTLISLGYDEEWVNGKFRNILEKSFKYAFDEYTKEQRMKYQFRR